MTWEIDIVQRAGRLLVSGEFKIRDAAEATTFLARFHDLTRRAGIIVAIAEKEPVAFGEKPGRPPLALPDHKPSSEQLTPREQEIFDLSKSGLSVPAIASHLGISPNTVYFNKTNIRKKKAGIVKPARPLLNDEQAAILKAYESGQTIRQIAERTGKQYDVIKSTLWRVREKLKRKAT